MKAAPKRLARPALLTVPGPAPGLALGLMLGLMLGLGGCAEQSCGSVAVLNALDGFDAQADLSHLGLVRDAVRTAPGPTPDSASCSVWERVRGPVPGQVVGQAPAPVLLRPQYYGVRRISTGWELSP